MHLNSFRPNILHDMQAAANGRDLRNSANGKFPAKSDWFSRKVYPYASERQVKRQQRKYIYLQMQGRLPLLIEAETQG